MTLRLAPSFIQFCLFAAGAIVTIHSASLQQAAAERPEFTCSSDVAAKDRPALVSKVQSSYQQISDLQARFTQESYFLGLNKRVSSDGEVFFKKPGMMDWRYEQPEEQRFVADGKTLWFFQPDLNQVTIGKFENAFNSSLPVSFLLGLGNLSEKFTASSACHTSGNRVVLRLQPVQADPTLEQFLLVIDKNTGMPIGARVVDVGGNETTILFEHISTALVLDTKQFTYEIPRGVDILDQRTQ